MSTISRRSLLSLGLAATAASLAGCAGSSTGGPLSRRIARCVWPTQKPQRPYHQQAELRGCLRKPPRRACSGGEIRLLAGGSSLSAPGGGIPRAGGNWHRGCRSSLAPPILHRRSWQGHALRRRCGSRGFRLVGNREDQHAAQLAGLGAAEGNGCPRPGDPLPSSWRRRAGRASQEVRQARSGRGRCTSSPTTATPVIASTVRPSPRRSAPTCRPAASAWSTRTSSISTSALSRARRWSSCPEASGSNGNTERVKRRQTSRTAGGADP